MTAGAPVESEIKLRASGPEAAREAVARLGATGVRPRHFEDNVLLDDDGRSLLGQGCVLRLRRTPHGARLTWKGPRQTLEGVKRRTEIETDVGDADAFEAILARLGLRKVFRYQKYRESFAWRDAEIVVDETPIGTFLEIEGPLPTIHEAARALGARSEDYIADSYVSLFFAAGGQGDMVFP